MRKKMFLMILFIISCSIHAIAQTDYYYYKGKKIPLYVNDNKVCVSIPKVCEKTIERFQTNVKVQKKIKDDAFDISVISLSELEKFASLDSWKEDAKSVIITPSYNTTENKEVFSSPYLNVRLKKEEDIDLLKSYAEMYGLKIVRRDDFLPMWYVLSVSTNTGKNTLEIANSLWESGIFAASVPDFCADNLICSDDLTRSNDPLFNQQWGLHNSTYPGIDISADSAWNYATGRNVKIAILDQGVYVNHLDLASNIDSLIYDTETGTSQYKLYGDHGTHCAGIAAAVNNNYFGIAGVAPDATIIPISNELKLQTGVHEKLADGIIWAYQHGADIISNSWHLPTHNDKIDEAIWGAFMYGRQGKGCVIVFASGNVENDSINYNVSYPANCNDTILVVGAIDSLGTRASFSKYGTELDVVAPGVHILSTLPYHFMGFKDGTSMACPHVSGVAALILERNPELTVTQVNSIINSNAKKLSGVNFNVVKQDGMWNTEYGYGLVDAYSSVMNTPTVIYIQNENITGTSIISADNIYVGRDVTDRKEHGDVILGQGDITLNAGYVKIKNSTKVPYGTKLKIANQ